MTKLEHSLKIGNSINVNQETTLKLKMHPKAV